MYDFRKKSDPNQYSMGRRMEKNKKQAAGSAGKPADTKAAPDGIRTEPGSGVPVFLLVIIVLVSGAVSMGWYFSKITDVAEIRVEGLYFTHEAEVLYAAGIPLKSRADSIDFMTSITRIERLPYVESASIELSNTGRVLVHIKERKPIALLLNGNRTAYVDQYGVVLPVLPGKAEHVPLVYGFKFQHGDSLTQPEFNRIRDFLTEAASKPAIWGTISEVVYTKGEGIVALSHENGVRLVFGHDEFGRRLNKWEAFYTQMVPRKGINRFQSVDLRYRGQIVTRET